jgi:hypothetical protein
MAVMPIGVEGTRMAAAGTRYRLFGK